MEKLNLTVEDILNKEFKVDFKGYYAKEVDEFLDLILEDYQIAEENFLELKTKIEELETELKNSNDKILELEGRQKVLDLSNTTSYSSVDLLKRVSRLEEEIFNKK